ncbi:unnamed protein product, partial [Polarella glacialis]
YYCNSESGLTMWEHPAEVLLPAQYMKMRAAERLLDDSYVTDIMMLSAAATNESGGSFYSKGVMGSTASTAAPGFRKALTADGDMDAEDVQIQLAQTVMELEKERANTEKLRSYCAGLSDRMEIAEKNAQEASSLFSKAEQTQLLERTHAEEARAGLDAEVKAKFELTVADLEAERARANQASEKCAELETRHKLAEERAQEADLRFSQSQLRLDEMAVTPSVPQPDPEVHGRLSRAEAELEAERVRTKQARAMCDDLRNSHQKALEDVQEARLAEEQVLSQCAVQLALEELRCATPATPGSNFLDTLEEGRERDEQALPSKEGSVISNDATGGTGDRALSRRVAQEQQDQQNKEVQQQYEEAVRRAEQAIAEHAELAQRHQAALAELKEAEGAKDSAIYRVTELEKEVQHQAAEAAVEISTAAAERQNYERQLQELRGQLERKHEEENTLQVTQDLQLEETKRDLGKQLLDATSSSNAYQEQLEKTALELFHSKLSGEQVAERADRIEAELLVGTVRLEQADAECSTWRSRHEAAVNEVAEAEAARKSLEGTLDHLRHELKDMEAALSAGGDDRIAVLQAALANEQHRLDELLQSQAALDRNKQQLESQLQDAAASTRALQAKLAQTTDELGSAQSAKEDALNCKARAEAESQHALQLAQAAETARLEIEARLKEMESTQKLNALQETQLFEASTTALKAAMAETIAEVGSARTATEEAQRRQAQAEAETHQALQLAREAEMQLAREAEERVLGIESKLRETEATTQLESQLQDAAASTRALQAKLAQTTDELGSAQSAKEDALNCKAQAEDKSQHALQLAEAAETARLEIEARLHEMESTQKLNALQETQLFEASTTALKEATAETIAEVGSARTATEEAQRCQAQAEAETHQALQLAREAEMQLAREAEERVLGIESKLRETEATTQLESQLQDAAASTRALQAKLAQTTDELGSAQSAKEDALNCKARAEAESQHALQLAQAAETARLEIEARLKEMESTQKLESTQMPFPPSLASPPVVASDEVELEPPNLEQHVANASEEISLESTQMPSPPELPPPPAVTSDEVELEPPKLKEIPLEATQMPFAPKPPPPPDVKPPPPPD